MLDTSESKAVPGHQFVPTEISDVPERGMDLGDVPPDKRPGFQAAHDGRIGPEVLLDRTPASVLDRSASLDDASDRDGPSIG